MGRDTITPRQAAGLDPMPPARIGPRGPHGPDRPDQVARDTGGRPQGGMYDGIRDKARRAAGLRG